MPAPAEPRRVPPNGLHALWIPLESWSEACHWDQPQYQGDRTNLTCRVHTPNGGLMLSTGSQLATLDGTSCWLGYPPLSADGDLLIHHLDAQKNLEPLSADPLPFPPANGTVVIDPGHGGQNTGTQSIADRTSEKDWTLDWALRLAPLLTANGWRVVLTRTNDVDVSLADRVSLADAVKADLFVSLHFNSGFPNTELTGLETFCLTPVGLPSTLTRDYEDDLTKEFPNNAYDGENLRYAFRLHRAVLDATHTADRGIRRARFMGVLRGQNRPAVLLEAGYLSNPREARLIATPAYRQRLAQAVVRALTTPDLLFTHAAEGGAPGQGSP
jgi:N-acetylmuramoyl-L-alanine amidase